MATISRFERFLEDLIWDYGHVTMLHIVENCKQIWLMWPQLQAQCGHVDLKNLDIVDTTTLADHNLKLWFCNGLVVTLAAFAQCCYNRNLKPLIHVWKWLWLILLLLQWHMVSLFSISVWWYVYSFTGYSTFSITETSMVYHPLSSLLSVLVHLHHMGMLSPQSLEFQCVIWEESLLSFVNSAKWG